MPRIDPWQQALVDEGVIGTPLEKLANSIRMQESGGNNDAVSNRGATGWMQVMPDTFSEIADPGWDIRDPYHNARAGVRYLKNGWDSSGGDPKLTSIYYYGGPGGMKKAMNGVAVSDPVNPDYPNTFQYADQVLDRVGPVTNEFKGKNMQSNGGALKQTRAALNFTDPMSVYTQALANQPTEPAQMSPEQIQMLTANRQQRASMLPMAIGASMSGNRQIRGTGGALMQDAMEAQNPMQMGDDGWLTPDGQMITNPFAQQRNETARRDSALSLAVSAAKANQQRSSYFTTVPTNDGYVRMNARTGEWDFVTDDQGNPLRPPQYDPTVMRGVEAAKGEGGVVGKDKGEKIVNAPKVIEEGEATIKLVDELLDHPGFEQAVGKSRYFGMQHIYGTDAYDWDVRHKQIQGQQFLQAFEKLKGGGQITEIEGTKAEQAMARMNSGGSEEDFREAAKDFQEVIRKGVERARQGITVAPTGQPQGTPAGQSSTGAGGVSKDDIDEELRRRGQM